MIKDKIEEYRAELIAAHQPALDMAIAKLEARMEVHDITTPIAPNGEEVETVYSGGIKQEAMRLPAYYATAELAIAAWLQVAEAMPGFRRILYWRKRPKLELHWERACFPDGTVEPINTALDLNIFVHERWTVRARLAFG